MSIPLPETARPRAHVSPHVVIIGGGVAGLSAAWYLQREARGAVTYTLLERSGRWGGKIQTEMVARPGGSFLLEAGPDGFITRKPWARALADELGLTARMIDPQQANSHTFVLHRGRPLPMPDGMRLLAPTKVLPFLRSPLFSPWGKARIGLEALLPPRRDEADESLAAFVRRRLGAEALDRLGDPLLAGVYNAEPERQSMLATFPQFPALERQHGSVIRGLRAAERKRATDGAIDDAAPFFSLDSGAETLTRALVAQLDGDLRLKTSVASIEREGAAYGVVLGDGSRLRADAVILATSAQVTAALLRESVPTAAEVLGRIRFASIGATYLGYRRRDVHHPLNGFGVVIPSSERRHIDGVTWASSKWPGRAPADYVLMRVFFGGPHTRDMMTFSDDALHATIRDELASMLGVTAPPLFYRTYRWQDGYPQYDVGHLQRVAAIEAALPARLSVAGSSYWGVGVPDCIRQGQAAARQVIAGVGAAGAHALSVPEP